jgi:hypothetical protein
MSRLCVAAIVAVSALALLVPAVLVPAARAQEAGTIQVLQSTGELGRKGETGSAKGGDIPAGAVLQAGQAPANATPATLAAKPPAATAALSFAPGEVVTLSTGASAGRSGTPERGEYRLSGAAHLLLDLGEPPGREIVVNGAVLSLGKAHLFFDGWVSPPRIYVVDGYAKLAAPGQPSAEGVDVVAGKWIVLDGNNPRIEGEPGAPVTDPLLAWSQLAGFEVAGPYKYAGDAFAADAKLRVNRNDILVQIAGEKIAVFEGDQLITEDGQRVRVQFRSGDKVGLTGKTVFKIDEYLPERQEKPSILFSVLGKVRALIASRLAPDSVRVKTATATIGVKGTDFNTIAEEQSTLVETVDGTVGVSDVTGANEVALGPGTRSTVAEGGSPSVPSAIAPARLQELLNEGAALGLIAAAAAVVPPVPVPLPVVPVPPPPPPPPPPAPPAAAAAPAPAPAAPAANLCERLGRAYQDSIAAKTGASQDEIYFGLRGEFGCADIPKAAGND